MSGSFDCTSPSTSKIASTSVYLSLVDSPEFTFGIMDNGFQRSVQHRRQSTDILTLVEVVTNSERFQVLIAVQLLVIGVGDLGKLGFILWCQDGLVSPRK